MTETAFKGLKQCPVDFDHHSAEHAQNWPSIYDELRSAHPTAWSPRYGGFWVASRYSDIVSIAQNLDCISSLKIVDPETGEEKGGNTIPIIPNARTEPGEIDSPEWDAVRGFLMRRFSPKAAEQLRERARTIAAALLDRVIETGRMDLVHDLTGPLPAIMTVVDIFGFGVDEWQPFAEAFHARAALKRGDPAWEAASAELRRFRRRLGEEIERRRAEPKDDLIGLLANGEIDGRPLDQDRIQAIGWQLFSGGVDTTTALTSHALIYLGENPAERQRLIDDATLIPRACEEFVRFFTPIHGAGRNVKQDARINGFPLEAGDRIFLAYAAANRDPAVFEDPHELKLDRTPNRHVGWGSGQHRCLGSFFARMMFQSMLEAVLTRLPDYELVLGGVRRYQSIGYANGVVSAEIRFTPSRRVGAVL